MARSGPLLPNKGTGGGRRRPIDFAWELGDTSHDKRAVELGVCTYPDERTDRHWLIRWYVGSYEGSQYYRVIQLVEESAEPRFLTNWGPITRTLGSNTSTFYTWYTLGDLDLGERTALGDIAQDMNVYAPNGIYNCQHWLIDVLAAAVEAGLFNRQYIKQVVEANGQSDPRL